MRIWRASAVFTYKSARLSMYALPVKGLIESDYNPCGVPIKEIQQRLVSSRAMQTFIEDTTLLDVLPERKRERERFFSSVIFKVT